MKKRPTNTAGRNQPSALDDFVAFFRYTLAGVSLNASFYVLSLVLIYYVHLTAWQATAILYPIGVAFSFLANRAWSFADRKRTPAEFWKYLLVYAAAYPATIVITWAQERAGAPSWLASLITLIASAIAVFLLLNRWVFRKTPAAERTPTAQF